MLSNFRNIKSCELSLSDKCNVFCGENGSGKTSLLEAIYLYWNGRSFRTSNLNHIVQHKQNELLVHGKAKSSEQTLAYGLQFIKKTKDRRYRLAGEKVKRSSDLASLLPVYYFSPQSENLLSGSPGNRRSLLFWYLFHVEPTFKVRYAALQKAVKHRNQLLRHNVADSEFYFWDAEIAKLSAELRDFTDNEVETLRIVFKEECHKVDDNAFLLKTLINRIATLEVKYSWENEQDLFEQLTAKREYEKKLGYSTLGFQKCDFRLVDSSGVASYSRGEEKALSLILLVSVFCSIYNKTKKNMLILLDDLSSELDESFIATLLKKFSNLPLQMCITTLTKDALIKKVEEHFLDFKLFHVKQGVVTEEQNV